MIERAAKNNEVDIIISEDGKTVFSIRTREDKNLEYYVERLEFDAEEEIHYWTQEMLPRQGIFGSVDEAKTKIIAEFADIPLKTG